MRLKVEAAKSREKCFGKWCVTQIPTKLKIADS